MAAQTMEISDIPASTSTPPSAQVVDVELWLGRAEDPSQVRAFTPGAAEYVPRHRKDPSQS